MAYETNTAPTAVLSGFVAGIFTAADYERQKSQQIAHHPLSLGLNAPALAVPNA